MNSLRYSVRVSCLILLGLFAVAPLVLAAPNSQINYQGKLTDNSGVAVTDGDYDMEFKLYTAPTGGAAIWTETLNGSDQVTVTNGLFSIMLGSTSALTSVDFNQTLYLGVNIDSDGEMTPRKILGTVPAAFEANNAQTLDGIATSSFLRSDQADTIEANSASTLLSIIQSGAGDILNLFDGGTEVFTVLDGGNVGIGTTSPNAKLSVRGNVDVFNDALTLPTPGATADANSINQKLVLAPTANYTTGSVSANNQYNETVLSSDTSATNLSNFNVNGSSLYTLNTSGVNVSGITGIANTAESDSAGTVQFLEGVTNTVLTETGQTGAVTNMRGSSNFGYRIGTGAVTNYIGDYVFLGNYVSGTIANTYGFKVDQIYNNVGTMTNTYGVHVGDITSGTQTNTPFSFYASDANAHNYFAGNVGIGTTTPNTKLTIEGAEDTALIALGDSTNGTQANVYTGTTTPDGRVSAPRGSLFIDTSSAQMYQNTDAGTGWSPFTNGTTTHMAKMTRDAAQSIPNGTIEKIAFDNIDFDTGGIADATTNDRFDIKKDGKYMVQAKWRAQNLDDQEGANVYIYLNGSNVSSNSITVSWPNTNQTSAVQTLEVLDLQAGDYLEMYVYQLEDASQDTLTDVSNKPLMSVIELAPSGGTGIDLYTDAGDDTYLTSTSDNLLIGTTTNDAAAKFVVRQQNANDIVNIFDGSTEVFTILDGGNVGIGTSSPASKLDVWGDFRVGTSGVPTLFADVSANALGLATTTPNYTLTVAGDLMATGALYDNSYSAGTNGYVLQTTGTGFNWVATSSLGIGGSSVTFGTDNQIPFTNSGGTDYDYSSNFTFDGTNFGLGSTTPNTKLTIEAAEDTALIALGDSTNGTQANVYTGTTTPNGRITAPRGSLYIDTSSAQMYQNTDAGTGWSPFTNGTTTHMAKMTRDAVQSIPNSSDTKIAFDNIEFDTGGIADATTNDRFDIKKAGKYLVNASWRTPNLDSTEYNRIYVYKNGSPVARNSANSSGTNYGIDINVIVSLDLVPGDYIEMWVYHTEGASQDTFTSEESKPRMSIIELAPSGGTGIDLYTDAGDDTYLTSTSDNLLIGTTTNDAAAKFVVRQQNANDIVNIFDGSTEVFTILDGGNVGIGTSSPASKLDVWGDFRVGTSGVPTLFADVSANALGLATTTPNYTLTVAGDLMATGALYDNSYSAGTNGYVLQTTGTGFNWVATSSLGIGGSSVTFGTDNQIPFTNSGGTDYDYSSNFTFDGTNLGIGSSTPNTRLTIEGAEDTALIALGDSTNGTQANVYTGTTTPNGRITAPRGSLYIDTSSAQMYQNTDAGTGWSPFTNGTTTHMAKMTRDAAQSIPNDTETKVAFDNIEYDTGGIADATTNDRFDIKKDGKYYISGAWVSWGAVDVGEFINAYIYVNGVKIRETLSYSSQTDGFPAVEVNHVADLQAGDYVEFHIRHTEGAALNTETNATVKPQMSVIELAPSGGTGIDLFTDAGSDSYLTSTSDNLLIGTTTNAASAKFVVRQQNANDIVNIFDGSTEVFTILDGGNVGIGTSSPASKLDVWGDFRVGTSGVPTLFADVSANALGLATTTPNYTLTVAGDLMATGALYDNSYSAGTNGYVLQTTGTGFNWVATSSLGIGGSSVTFGTDNQIPFTNSGGTDYDYSSNFTFDGTNFGLGSTTPNTKLTIEAAEDTALIALGDSTNGTQANVYTGTTTPNGRITAPRGSLYIDTSSAQMYQNTDAGTGWSPFTNGTTTHMAKMTRDAAQSISNDTWTKIAFDNIDFDTGGIADATTNDRVDIKKDGKYTISAQWSPAIGVDDGEYVATAIYVNGTAVIDSVIYTSVTDSFIRPGSIIDFMDLQAGDYIEMYVKHTEGAALNTNTTDQTKPRMSVVELAPSGGTGIDLFTDAGSDSYLTSTSDNLLIGTTTNDAAAKFVIRQQNAADIVNIFDGSTEVFTILDGGNIGIGTSSPNAKLTVRGNVEVFNDTLSLPTSGSVDRVNSVEQTLQLSPTANYTAGIVDVIGSRNHLNVVSSTTATNLSNMYAIGSESRVDYDAAAPLGGLTGGYNHVVASSVGAMNYARGGMNLVYSDSTGAVTEMSGGVNVVQRAGSGAVTNLNGSLLEVGNFAAGTVTNVHGLSLANLYNTAGTITNTYGVHIGDITTGNQTNTPFSFYASDPNTHNYFAGNVGIGTTSPSQKLTVQGNSYFSGSVGIGTSPASEKLTVAGTINISESSQGYEIDGSRILYASTTNMGVFVGRQAGKDVLSDGIRNTAVGYQSLYNTTSADNNTAVGYQALFGNTTGSGGTAIGRSALSANTTGISNTAVGYNAMKSNTTGYDNAVLGESALFSQTVGRYNIAFGVNAGYDLNNATGTGANTLLGYNTGRGLVTGVNNTIVGANVTGLSSTLSNNIILADGAGNQRLNINSSGNVGIGTSSPASKLDVWGDFRVGTSGVPTLFADVSANALGLATTTPNYTLTVAGDLMATGALYDNSYSAGTNGYVLQTTGTGFNWVATSSLGIGGSSVTFGTDNQIPFTNSGGTDYDYSANFTFDGTTFVAPTTTIAGNLTLSGSVANIALGSNWLSGDGDDEGIFVDGSGNVGIGTTGPLSTFSIYNRIIFDEGGGVVTDGPDIRFSNAGLIAADNSLYLNIDSDNNNTEGAFIVSKDATTTAGTELFRIQENGNVGIATTSPSSRLALEVDSFSGAGIAGISQYINTANSVDGAVQFGSYYNLNASNTATTTVVGGIYRVADDTAFGNTVRGLEVQTNRGANTQGENTALSGFARTFGVRGFSSGDAGGTFEPAGGFFETGGTTQGNAIRGYSSSITTASLLSLFQDTSNFTGTGLEMNFGNTTGDFASSSSKYLDFQNAGTSVFTVSAYGTTTIGNGGTTIMAGLQIGYGGICVDDDGSCNASTTGLISSVDSYLGKSDLAENYFSPQSLQTGEVVTLAGELSVARAESGSPLPVLGVVSTNPGLLLGSDDTSTRSGEKAFPIALSGRVPIILSNENGAIEKGDQLMLSSLPGVAMKATGTGAVIGMALEDFNEDRYYSDTFINQFGENLVEPIYDPVRTNLDPRIDDGCYYGGGVAAGEEDCVPLQATTSLGQIAEANDVAEQASIDEQLAAMATVPSETRSTSDGEVKVGQVVMFVNLSYRWMTDEQTDLLAALMAAPSTLSQDEELAETETVFDRVVALANSFVDGVLSIFTLKAERVETSELCVDDVCLTSDQLRTLLEGAGGAAASGSTATPAAPETQEDPELSPDPEPQAPEAESPAPAPTPTPEPTPDPEVEEVELTATSTELMATSTPETSDERASSTPVTTNSASAAAPVSPIPPAPAPEPEPELEEEPSAASSTPEPVAEPVSNPIPE